MIARLVGGRGDGWLYETFNDVVYITLIDRVPRSPSRAVSPAVKALMNRADHQWEGYRRSQFSATGGDDPIEDDRGYAQFEVFEVFETKRVLHPLPATWKPLTPPEDRSGVVLQEYLQQLSASEPAKEVVRLKQLLRLAGYGRSSALSMPLNGPTGARTFHHAEVG